MVEFQVPFELACIVRRAIQYVSISISIYEEFWSVCEEMYDGVNVTELFLGSAKK